MEIVLAKLIPTQVPWQIEWGTSFPPGTLITVDAIKEVSIIDEYIKYSNIISLQPTVEKNNWEMELTIESFKQLGIKQGDWIYARTSEFGGLVESIERDDALIKLSGTNFRGYLARHIVTPASIFKSDKFEAYIYRTLPANDLLWDVWELDHTRGSTSGMYSDPYVVGKVETTPTISDKWRFDSYLSAMSKSLRANGMRLETLQIDIDYDNLSEDIMLPTFYKGEQSFVFSLAAKPIVDYSTDELLSQDFDIRIYAKDSSQNSRRFLWCLGSGELENREIAILDKGEPVEVGTLDTLGSMWDSDIYDYPNAESREELIKAGQERYNEYYGHQKQMELFVDDPRIEFFLGDIVGGVDFVTGIETKAEITSKEFVSTPTSQQVIYKIGEM